MASILTLLILFLFQIFDLKELHPNDDGPYG